MPTSSAGSAGKGDRIPRHGGLVAAMLLPACVLTLLAGLALWRDWHAAQREAMARAHEIAVETGQRLAEFLAGVAGAEHSRFDRFEVGPTNELVRPSPGRWPPEPVPWEDPPEDPLQADWRSGRAAMDRENWAAAQPAWDTFLTNSSGGAEPERWERHRRLARFEQGLALEKQGRIALAVERFDQLLRVPERGGSDGLSESGVPFAQWAALRILELAAGRFEALPERWRKAPGEVGDILGSTPPSPYLGPMLAELVRLTGGRAGGAPASATYEGAERARASYRESARRFPGASLWPAGFWLAGEAATNAVLVLHLGSSGVAYGTNATGVTRAYALLPVATIARTVEAAARAVDRRGDFSVGVAVAGREIVPEFAARMITPGREILAGMANRIEGGVDYSVSVGLVQPLEYYAGLRRRVWMFGGLIGAAALASVLAAWVLHRSLVRQFELNQAKSNFVSSVSHELRAPLGSIRLLAEGLERGTVSEPDRRMEYFRLIGQETRRLGALVENVLDFSRIEQGRKRYEIEIADLAALVRGTLQLFEPLASARDVRLASEISNQPGGEEAWIDGRAIQQALLNLLDNALKHSPAGATIRVRLPGSPETGAFRLSVSDEGPGIPAADHERIFEPFFRRGSELRRETQGVGIGLSIVRHIIDGHRGRIEVDSESGRGATFTLVLPGSPGDRRSSKPDDESWIA